MESENSGVMELISRADQVSGALGLALASQIRQLCPEAPEVLLLGVMALCYRVETNSEPCMELTRSSFEDVVHEWAGQDDQKLADDLLGVVDAAGSDDDLAEAVRACHSVVGSSPDDNLPLICVRSRLNGVSRLYFRRYFLYEQQVARYISAHSAWRIPDLAAGDEAAALPLKEAADILFEIFRSPAESEDQTQAEADWQKVASLIAAGSNFSVITGGPGTGKTTTLTNILFLLLCLNPELKTIALAAPTGKAASRIGGSIDESLKKYQANRAQVLAALQKIRPGADDAELDRILSLIPKEAMTLARLLKMYEHEPQARYNQSHPLNCQILAIDEMSMVDLPLFAKTCCAMPERARLILLGDRDQLFSVETGSVFADLCAYLKGTEQDAQTVGAYLKKVTGYAPERLLQDQPGLSGHMVELRKSHRFNQWIGGLAKIVNSQDDGSDKTKLVLDQISKGRDVLYWLDTTSPEPDEEQRTYHDRVSRTVRRLALQAVHPEDGESGNARGSYAAFLNFIFYGIRQENPGQTQDAVGTESTDQMFLGLNWTDKVKLAENIENAFKYLDQFRILCSNREGPLGQNNFNQQIVNAVRQHYGQFAGRDEWFPGRVVLVTKNDPGHGINNGDVGFVIPNDVRDLGVGVSVVFPGRGKEGDIHSVAPIYLESVEDGYAMTIHKSQGSEYRDVWLALAAEDNPVINKSLFYTGITRAKSSLTIISNKEILAPACSRQPHRQSGLGDQLERQMAGESRAITAQ